MTVEFVRDDTLKMDIGVANRQGFDSFGQNAKITQMFSDKQALEVAILFM
jgi:hypothetical protein